MKFTPIFSRKELSAMRRKERAKYTKWYFENMYWVEDYPGKKHYRSFQYDDPKHEKRFEYLAATLIKYFKFKTILDAGFGMGHIVRNFLNLGYKVKGVEISEDAIKHFVPDLKSKKIVVKAGLEKLPFRSDAFDLVFCSDVMEHIPMFDVVASIKELIRVTKRYLVLTINLDHPYQYHPSILPRDMWERLFMAGTKLKHLKNLEQRVERETKKKYSEYDWFIFEKFTN